MRALRLCLLVGSVLLAACGSREAEMAEDSPPAARLAAASLPASFEGQLDLSMVESTEDDDGSQVYLGEFTTGGETVFVLVESSLVNAAGIDDATDGTPVRVTLSVREGSGGDATYTISTVEKT